MQELFPQFVKSPEAMQKLGERIATTLRCGDVVALIGDLGAGKTHITKGIASALGFTGTVTSPTFAIAQEYQECQPPIVHFDLYRMEQAEELLSIGWEDYLENNTILIVEWADRFPELMPSGTHCLHIEHIQEGRLVTYTPLH